MLTPTYAMGSPYGSLTRSNKPLLHAYLCVPSSVTESGSTVVRTRCPTVARVLIYRFSLLVRSYLQWLSPRRSGPPGVNTYLSAHERRVYLPGLQWIEDFILCCGLVPPDQPNSVSVRHPVRLRYSAAAERLSPRVLILPPACHTATPFASIRLGLGLVIYRSHDIYSPLRIRAVPGTQQANPEGPRTSAPDSQRSLPSKAILFFPLTLLTCVLT